MTPHRAYAILKTMRRDVRQQFTRADDRFKALDAAVHVLRDHSGQCAPVEQIQTYDATPDQDNIPRFPDDLLED